MKPLPKFNENEARVEAIKFLQDRWDNEFPEAYWKKKQTKENFITSNIEAIVKQKRKDWHFVWTRKQLEEGERILDRMLRDLSPEQRELVNDYLANRLDEAR